MKELEKCELCWTWSEKSKLIDGKNNQGLDCRRHETVEHCLAHLAWRVGGESIDDAVIRLYGKAIPIGEVDFKGKGLYVGGQ